METSCQENPVATLTVLTATSPLPSHFCTSIPPGLTSHSISPRLPPPPTPPPSLLLLLLLLAVLLLEELLPNSFLEYLSLNIVVAGPTMLLGSGSNGQRQEVVTGGCGAELVMLPWNKRSGFTAYI